MTDTVPEPTAAEQVEAPQWICRNCGNFNRSLDEHCEQCGFARNYDPEAAPQVSYAEFQADRKSPLALVRDRLLFYLKLVRDVLLCVFAVVALVVSARLLANWPFPTPYARDAEQLADAVLLVQASVDEGVTYEQYSSLLANLVVEKTKFEKIYEQTEYRQRVSYQKLAQAAEYYVLARQAWANEMRNSDIRRIDPTAMTTSAPTDVKSRWTTAADNAMQGVSDLR